MLDRGEMWAIHFTASIPKMKSENRFAADDRRNNRPFLKLRPQICSSRSVYTNCLKLFARRAPSE